MIVDITKKKSLENGTVKGHIDNKRTEGKQRVSHLTSLKIEMDEQI